MRQSFLLSAAFILVILPATILAQDWESRVLALKPRDPQLSGNDVLDLLERRASAVLGRIPHARTAKEADKSRTRLRSRLKRSLGLDRFPPIVLNARTVGILDRGAYRLEKVIYQTFPGTDVPAHLYLPSGLAEPAPAVLFYPGHWLPDSKSRENFQIFCINMARLGFVVLSFDPFGQGERGISWRDHRRTSALLAGVSQQGFAEYETRCAIEYLLSRPEVDKSRIGMTGASGGGYNSWITAALDDRISVVVPVVGTSDFLEQIRVCRPLDWYKAKEHCHFVPGLIRYANNHELLAMSAPKPLLIIAATEDQSFPVQGVRQVFEYGSMLYSSYGKASSIGFFEDSSAGHGYQHRKREAAYGWFLYWLMGQGDARPFPEPETTTFPSDSPELRCFPVGENRPAGPGMEEMVSDLSDRSQNTLPITGSELQRILGNLPKPIPFQGRLAKRPVQRLLIPSEQGLEIPVFIIRPQRERGLLLVASDQGKESALGDPFVKEAIRSGWAVCGIDPRGIGELESDKKGWIFAVSLLLGENFVWRQGWDIKSVLEFVYSSEVFSGKPMGVYGLGSNMSLAISYALTQRRFDGHLPPDFFVLAKGFLTFRHFLNRPASMRRSFKLISEGQPEAEVIDREIPSFYFPFDVLSGFDIPRLLAQINSRGLVIAPIDGDWKPLSAKTARTILPENIEIMPCKVTETIIPFLSSFLDTKHPGK